MEREGGDLKDTQSNTNTQNGALNVDLFQNNF